MVRQHQVRSFSLRTYVLQINKVRVANAKKCLSVELVAKKLIEAKGDELKKEFIRL